MPRLERDMHHTLNSRNDWTVRPQAKALRENRWLIPPLDRDTHEELHRDCPQVPLLGYHALQYTVRNFEAYPGDYVKSLEALMSTIEESGERPQAHRLEKALGGLVVETLSLQRPYIQEGLVVPRMAA